MTVQEHTKNMFNKFGHEYMCTRKKKRPERAYNEFLEVPAMLKAVGNINGKKLLDIGCGAGVHVKRYIKKGAKCSGIDLSKTMIDLAKENCQDIEFKVGSITKLPYKGCQFDVVTASLCIDYVKNLGIAFNEIHRVLKKGGLFYYSNESPISSARGKFENKKFKIEGIGEFVDKSTGKQIALGQAWTEGLAQWEMVPGMIMKTYNKTFRTQLKALVNNNLELIDFIDCKPTFGFKKINARAYEVFTKFPIFSIFVVKKKI